MSRTLLSFAVFVGLAAFSDAVSAQNGTVQQPVFRRFSVGTTVSVPDRGGAFLGRVARAAESRSRFGPLRSGTSTGLFREHFGASAHVRIHDLRETDQRLLRQGVRSARIPTGRPLPGNAEHAYRSLLSRHYASQLSRRSSSTAKRKPRLAPAGNRNSVFGNEDPAERFYRLGLRAEQRGRHSLARLHDRMAVKNGSALARAKLTPRVLSAARSQH